MKFTLTFVFFILITTTVMSQKDYYYNMPKASKEFTAATVTSRMIDGLGFRYYWATYGLAEKDLAYRPSKNARTSLETLKHIYDLSKVILNSLIEKSTTGNKTSQMTFDELRKSTLLNFEESSKVLRNAKDVSEFKIIFGKTELPFWNQINGPISDALWHLGQVVSFRRSSGNPFPKGVNVLMGVKKD